MKKILALVVAVCMVFSLVPVALAADAEGFDLPEKVEISFKVGESTLMINGKSVEVETPYIAGEGTTLVPLRVITEAFGARVTWVNDTKQIILEYPDVDITLQIGNVTAVVNNHTETLPVAPALSPNGVTMVPLRFISETFGATVGYDNATAAITVMKENVVEETTIATSNDLPRIGDSYWGWSMMTPAGMMMTERFFDGCYTLFEDEADSLLSVDIYDVSEYEGSVYDDYYNDVQTIFSGFTFSRLEKTTDAKGNKCIRITARDKEDYVDIYVIYENDYCYEVVFTTKKENSEAIVTLGAILESFVLDFAATEDMKKATYDLSNVGEDGLRAVYDEEVKVSFKVPATCIDANSKELNKIKFLGGKSDDVTEIGMGVYSKTESATAKLLAEADREHNSKYYNPDICVTSNVFEYDKNSIGENQYYYWVTTTGLSSGDYVFYDLFFEKGDYVYNLSVTAPKGQENLFDATVATLEVKLLDSEETGVFIRPDRESVPRTVETNQWALELTSDWVDYSQATSSGATFVNIYSASVMTVNCLDPGEEMTPKDMPEFVDAYNTALKKEGWTISKRTTKEKLGNKEFYTFQRYKVLDDGTKLFATSYVIYMRGEIYIFTLTESEERTNSAATEEFKTIIGSLAAR